MGVSAFKADECDRQWLTDVTPFNYPYCSSFPSGIDGDQMTQLYGFLYQQSIYEAFRKRDQRTMGDVRATTALAAPLPFCLYSDAYTFDEYLRQLVNASFTGLMWSPEVRASNSREDLLNRIGMSSLAPQMCLNIWFMPHPVWEQYERDKNERGELLPQEEQDFISGRIREIANLRMSLLPYLYASFYRYYKEGLPPVRALVLDFPDDTVTWDIDDQYMFGDALMAAPFIGTAMERMVYFPKGQDWIDFRTNRRYAGGTYGVVNGTPGNVPLFVKNNTLLPLADPVQYVAKDTVFQITPRIYGDAPPPFVLAEDDGESFAYERGELSLVELSWKNSQLIVSRNGTYPQKRYTIGQPERITTISAEEILPTSLPKAGEFTPSLISEDAWFKASSTYGADRGDGLLLASTEGNARFAFHSDKEDAPFVTLFLRKPSLITGIEILNRIDEEGNRERAKSLTVWVSNDMENWTEIWRATQAEDAWDIALEKPVQAQNIRVGLRETNFLHLRRIHVFGTTL